jgi:hypothetical protein
MLTYTLGSNVDPMPPISRAEAHAAGIGAVIIVAGLATLFPAIAVGQQIAASANTFGGPIGAGLTIFAASAALVAGLLLSRRFRVAYGALLTIGWSIATLAHVAPGGVCAVETALALLALGGAATAATARLD